MITAPIYISQPRRGGKTKNYSLNLNVYRNMHFIVNNNLKKVFKGIISEQIKGKVYSTPIRVNYTLYWKRMSDLDNLQAVVTKYFQDALVELGCIAEDNFEHIVGNSYTVGGKDNKNPRFEIEIIENAKTH